MLETGQVQAAAHTYGLEDNALQIRRAEDIAHAVEALKGRADALYVVTDPLVNTNRIRINTLALGAQMPTMHGSRHDVEAGDLMSYGPNFPDLFRRAAAYVDKILKDEKPANIPVEQPTKFELVINLKAAKALGLEIPAITYSPARRGDRVNSKHPAAPPMTTSQKPAGEPGACGLRRGVAGGGGDALGRLVAFQCRRRYAVPPRLRRGAGGHRRQAPQRAVSLRAHQRLDQGSRTRTHRLRLRANSGG